MLASALAIISSKAYRGSSAPFIGLISNLNKHFLLMTNYISLLDLASFIKMGRSNYLKIKIAQFVLVGEG